MASLNELQGLGDNAGFQVDYANLPDEPTGGFTPPPQPGKYVFKLPANLENVWSTFEATIKDKKALRLSAVFRDADALEITQSVGGELNGHPFAGYVNNVERDRKEKGFASDMDYLLRVFGENGPFASNLDYANALKKHAGESFQAEITWRAWCDDRKDIRVMGADGSVVVVEGQVGCGKNVYQQDIPTSGGKYETRFLCPDCNAVLYPSATLRNFKTPPGA